MKEKAGIVWKETDYTVFKHLLGNRSVTPQRKAKIKNSIEKVGYVMNPIIVNYEMQVIDGQGRLAALEELGLPVFYVIDSDAGIEECVTMNIGQTNWSILDYVEKYAELGDENYIRLLSKYREAEKYGLTLAETSNILKNRLCVNGFSSNLIKRREYLLTEKEVADSSDAFVFLYRNINVINKIPGSGRAIKSALAWIVRNSGCDINRLESVLNTKWPAIDPVVDTVPEHFLSNMSDLYNKRLAGKNCILFDALYKVSLKNWK